MYPLQSLSLWYDVSPTDSRWTTSPPNGRVGLHFGSARLTGVSLRYGVLPGLSPCQRLTPTLKPQPLELISSVHFIFTCTYSPYLVSVSTCSGELHITVVHVGTSTTLLQSLVVMPLSGCPFSIYIVTCTCRCLAHHIHHVL